MTDSHLLSPPAAVCAAIATLLCPSALTCAPQGPDSSLRLAVTLNSPTASLVDGNGTTVHTFVSGLSTGLGAKFDHNGNLVRSVATLSVPGLAGVGGGIQRIGYDGTMLWDHRYSRAGPSPNATSHHDVATLPNGNVLLMAWEDLSVADAMAQGRDPAMILGTLFRPDHIVEIQQTGPTTGDVVWEWRVWDHLIQDFDSTKPNFGVIADHPERIDVNFPATQPSQGDWNHMNGIGYDPVHDWIALSVREQEEIWIIDHSTTTSEAAGSTGGLRGKGGDLLYRWGNPQAYDQGTAADQRLFRQHAPHFIPPGFLGAGNLLIYNNGGGFAGSSADEIQLPLDAQDNFILGANGRYGPIAPSWSVEGFSSQFMGSAVRLPNGNTLVCPALQGVLLEFDPNGLLVSVFNAGVSFQASFIDRSLWQTSTELSINSGGTIRWDIGAGSRVGNQLYFLLGSVSGATPGFVVDGVQIPLNPDAWLQTTIATANLPPFTNTLSMLNNSGSGTASFQIPGGILPPALVGAHFDHAVAVFDPALSLWTFATNSVGFDLVP